MAQKIINFGVGGPVGDTVNWRCVLGDDVLGAGDTTFFNLELTRPAADGPLGDGGVTVWVVKIGPPTLTIDNPGPVVGTDTGNTLLAGETNAVTFHVTNAPAGATPATYWLIGIIQWGLNPPEVGILPVP